ncbi:MAG: hypothetical protein FWG68_08715 [Defluviitaleaceae bacterium]|nr:hypothetical protein [Defluviitaleaceae bacterium]
MAKTQENSKKLFVGFDGCIDTLAKAVKSRDSANNTAYFDTIASFGEYLCGQAGKSCAIELDILDKKIGGNAPLLSMGAAALGLDVTCLGMFGVPQDEMFSKMANIQRYSYMEPAAATILEFNDGKVIMASSVPSAENAWREVCRATEDGGGITSIVQNADILALLNWSELAFSQQFWQEVLAILAKSPKKPAERHILFDLCDCTRKTAEEVVAVLGLIGEFSQYCTTVLSLNSNESQDVGKKIGFTISQNAENDNNPHKKFMQHLRDTFNINEIVIHTPKCSFAANNVSYHKQPTAYIEKPLFSTGAGDNFNAAYLYAVAIGLGLQERLAFCNKFVHGYISMGGYAGLV